MAEKLWFRIGEAAAEVGVSPHEIRYWERKIPEMRPRRSKGNIRYYHRDDLARLLAVRRWTESGFSAADCRELLLKGHVEHCLALGAARGDRGAAAAGAANAERGPGAGGAGAEGGAPDLGPVIDAVRGLLRRLEGPPPARRSGGA
jgi:DNA-binding transcriptional MerR regulator